MDLILAIVPFRLDDARRIGSRGGSRWTIGKYGHFPPHTLPRHVDPVHILRNAPLASAMSTHAAIFSAGVGQRENVAAVAVGDTEATSLGSSVAKTDDTHVVGFEKDSKVDTAATNDVNKSLVPVDVGGVEPEEGADTAVKLAGRMKCDVGIDIVASSVVGGRLLAPQQANKQAYQNTNSEEPQTDSVRRAFKGTMTVWSTSIGPIFGYLQARFLWCIGGGGGDRGGGGKVLLLVLEVEVEGVKVEEYGLAQGWQYTSTKAFGRLMRTRSTRMRKCKSRVPVRSRSGCG
ncbi:uncharacterized protein LACBIDRAFT_323300 [Laccaria bicolor S238N-H82]|uniref:Predicted protein n=1 Tax=Laccaria bicolor (strain S238N-H82 / ATCC MYA-4686) TaxID=486041 RepID=B0CZS2_LACBS|nr:uncharacterized protein LACBIDRAFT_323300 [Laccaria bicolor S238N-H82]EDR12666.1 predicted protein [Laccaria bicolor S238N-H82]|eukprot:XP_001876930.1 predicted protein [Laccaria bicolor S238N-H82]